MGSDILRARLKLVGLFALFFVPVFVAIYMNLSGSRWFGATTNHGTLVTPAVKLSSAGLRTPRAGPADTALFRDRWTLMLIGASLSDGSALDALYAMRQAREALGKDQDRVQRMVVVADPRGVDALTATDQGLAAVLADNDWIAMVTVQATSQANHQLEIKGAYICLVDPQGYLMMYYPAPAGEARRIAEAKGILKDLKRLLKISKIG